MSEVIASPDLTSHVKFPAANSFPAIIVGSLLPNENVWQYGPGVDCSPYNHAVISFTFSTVLTVDESVTISYIVQESDDNSTWTTLQAFDDQVLSEAADEEAFTNAVCLYVGGAKGWIRIGARANHSTEDEVVEDVTVLAATLAFIGGHSYPL
jgi:hypothetical protein